MDTKKMKMISCKEVLANLSYYVDEEGSAELRQVLEEHIAWCRRCQVVFDTTGRMLKIMRDAELFDVPLAVSARLYSRLEKVLSGD
ncbi:MAG TPA: zf-HC2 domain-containing protein [Candidatus Acidoferrales bacterium]